MRKLVHTRSNSDIRHDSFSKAFLVGPWIESHHNSLRGLSFRLRETRKQVLNSTLSYC